MIRFFPFIFILLWSSAFISSKVIVDNAPPFLALSMRFSVVALFLFLFFSFFLYSFVDKNFTPGFKILALSNSLSLKSTPT